MKVFRVLSIIVSLAIFIVGCATGPSYTKYKTTIQPVADGMGRIWFYRPSTIGFAVQPHVFLNGEIVGKAQPKCYFFVDRPPGDYEVKCSTEWTDKSNFKLAAGDEIYVRLSLGIGFFVGHIIPKEVDTSTGLKEIINRSLITADGANANLGSK
jgi:hypothetical protein